MKLPKLHVGNCIWLAVAFFSLTNFLLLPFGWAQTESGEVYKAAQRTFGEYNVAPDPIAANDGAYYFKLPLLYTGGPMNLGFLLIYRSDLMPAKLTFPEDFQEAFWWSYKYTFTSFLVNGNDVKTLQLANGNFVSFIEDNGFWRLVENSDSDLPDNGSAVRYQLHETTAYWYFVDPVAEQVLIFDKNAFDRIVRVIDRNGNQLIYGYASNFDDVPNRIEDGLGRSLDFTYSDIHSGNYRALSRVTDHGNRQINFTYEEGSDTGGDWWRLLTVTNAMNQTIAFTYTTLEDVPSSTIYRHNIATMQQPLGNVHTTQTYAIVEMNGTIAARVIEQEDADGNAVALAYGADKNEVTATWPDNSVSKFESHSYRSLPKGFTDATAKAVTFTKNDRQQLTSVSDRQGETSSFTYHEPTGKIASITNNNGDTISYTYIAQQQNISNPISGENVLITFYKLSQVAYPDNTTQQFAYDGQGNLITYTDRNDNDWTITYNSQGLPLTITNPDNGVSTYTYNADATVASYTNSDIGLITYGYDVYKRMVSITHPTGTAEFAYNLNDQVTSVTDERDKQYTYEYDANGNLLSITDPAGQQISYTYDTMDRTLSRTNRLGKTVDFTYHVANGLESLPATFTDAANNTYQYGYNSRAWLNQFSDPAGKTWQFGRDDEGRTTSITSPLGHITTLQLNKLGYIVGITNDLNQQTAFTRDKMSRITEVTDAENRTTGYTYNNRGQLAALNFADDTNINYSHNDSGFITRVTDQKGKEWDFSYTDMGRLESATDPLDNQWQYSYNNRGFLSQITYPGSDTQTLTYDAAGNLTRRVYSQDGLDLQYIYDDLNRLTTTNELVLTYNAEGQVTNTISHSTGFGADYDDNGRLQTVSYADNTFGATYQYDTRGLMTRVSDNLTNAWIEFDYDDSNRLIAIKRSNNVNTTITWDSASRLTRRQTVGPSGTLVDIQYTFNDAGEIIQMDADLPLNPADYLTTMVETFSHDDASQVSNADYQYDVRGRLLTASNKAFTWDSASRLTRLIVDGDISDYTYNGLGNMLTRTQNGVTTEYYYNYALSRSSIVAEKDNTRSWKSYFVYGAKGGLLYMIDATTTSASFYLFDNNGCSLGLADDVGVLTNCYAYTPLGQTVEQQGDSKQPFTYMGRYGARELAGNTAIWTSNNHYFDATSGKYMYRSSQLNKVGTGQESNPYKVPQQSGDIFSDTMANYKIDRGNFAASFDLGQGHRQETFSVTVTDDGSDAFDLGQETFTVTFSGVNDSPVNTLSNEEASLTFKSVDSDELLTTQAFENDSNEQLNCQSYQTDSLNVTIEGVANISEGKTLTEKYKLTQEELRAIGNSRAIRSTQQQLYPRQAY